MLAGKLQSECGEPVSLDQALSYLKPRGRISELAGSWKMDDKEAVEIKKSIRGLRKRWKRYADVSLHMPLKISGKLFNITGLSILEL